ncbi:MAG: radical SAM protein [Methanotrichaceae archaeon]
MRERLSEMPFLRSIALVLTYRCQVACPHCIIRAGPNRREELSLDNAFSWIRQIKKYQQGYIKALSLTGGEPFIDQDRLKKISSFAREQGLFVSVVTNAFWAATFEDAINCLKSQPSIEALAFSTDIYHQERIPLERIENAIRAARACGIPYDIHICTESKDEPSYRCTLERLKRLTDESNILTVITFLAGRASEMTHRSGYQLSDKPPVSACESGWSPVIFPNGKVMACVGPVIDIKASHPLFLGSLKESTLKEVLDRAESNSILHALRVWGPAMLISMAREAGLNGCLPETYIEGSICSACYELMSNSKINEFLESLAGNAEFRRKVAYARIYYLKETRMAELGGLIRPFQEVSVK